MEKRAFKTAYRAPASEALELYAEAIICDSGGDLTTSFSDWSEDDLINESF